MNTRIKIFSLFYLIISCLAVLVMLVSSFEQLNEKYLPSFLLAQKFALPILLASCAFVFLVFFEPERLKRRSNLLFMRIAMMVTAGLFSVFVTTVNMKVTSEPALFLYAVELASTIAVTVVFFSLKAEN